jgi:outer membrane biosynthesis protein TonB
VAGLQVDVKVYIDAGGTVIRAEPLSKGNSLVDYLSGVAVDAARQWRFSPARRGNQSVPSETVLHFHFGNSRE